jgi:hypothetical protein
MSGFHPAAVLLVWRHTITEDDGTRRATTPMHVVRVRSSERAVAQQNRLEGKVCEGTNPFLASQVLLIFAMLACAR